MAVGGAPPDAVTDWSAAESAGPLAVFGVRHHGPGSARSLVRALEAYQPDAILIEGPADADSLIAFVADEGLRPPVALLAYAADDPRISAFWPFADFSPEWQALRWAVGRGVEVGFCDLPATYVLASQQRTLLGDGEEPPGLPERTDGSGDETSDDTDPAAAALLEDPGRDPLATLAAAAGFDDPERWWEDLVESRLDGSSPFPGLTEAMAELRRHARPPRQRERQREAYMRQCIRARLRRGRERLAVVCGAWHAPALTWPLPPARHDTAVLRGLVKRAVRLTWVPWTHQRLSRASGYGAGITSPGWYRHLWTAPDAPVARWLTDVAGVLRQHDLPVSSAHVIEAVRLADTLATLRERPLAGLSEVTDATRAVLCDGNDDAVRLVMRTLVVGDVLGTVGERVPTVPLEADLVKTCRSLRIRREVQTRQWDLDLRRGIDRSRSELFHRLRILGLDWIRPARSEVENQGTFRETWTSRWRPELVLAVVEASVWGTTVADAAAERMGELILGASVDELARSLSDCLRADLPATVGELLAALSARAATDADVGHLMDALPQLARAQRYGDVRGTDGVALARVTEALLRRTCAALPQAAIGLDDDAAGALRRRIDAVSAALGLLSTPRGEGHPSAPSLRDEWWDTLRVLVDRPAVHELLQGRLVRILRDAGRIPDAARRLQLALSAGSPAERAAAWVEGFFGDGGVVLIHDVELLALFDSWVCGLSDHDFVVALPLVRRTLATFSAAERSTIGARIASSERGTPRPEEDAGFDPARARRAVQTVARLLGADLPEDDRPERSGSAP